MATSGDNRTIKSVMDEMLRSKVNGPLVRKKKVRQLKLKQAFQRNFQKYPLSKCVWIPELKKHVYEPPRYTKAVDPLERSYAKCCPNCYLSPCLMIGKERHFVEEHKDVLEERSFALCMGQVEAHNLLCRYFGKQYVKRMKIDSTELGLPRCVVKALPVLFEKAKAEAEGKFPSEEEDSVVTTLTQEEEEESEMMARFYGDAEDNDDQHG